MQAYLLEHFWHHVGFHLGAILGAKCATILILEPLGLDFGTLLLHRLGGGGFRPLSFLTFYLKAELAPYVSEVFRIPEFPATV